MNIASIVVTFNPDLSNLVSVLSSHDQTGVAGLILIDNGSVNQSDIHACALRCLNSVSLIWMPLKSNVGLGKALNEGIACAEVEGFTHIVMFDQDTVVPKMLVGELAHQFSSLASRGIKIGVIGPTYVDPRTNAEYPQCLMNGIFLKKVWPSTSSDECMEVSFIITSGTFAPVQVIRDIGLMREDFFIDCIDVEWCFRARYKGYRVFCTKAVAMLHTIGDKRVRSLGRDVSIHSPTRRYYMARNSIYLIRLSTVPFAYRLRQIIMTFVRIPLFLWSVRFSPEYIRCIFSGVVDGVSTPLKKME